MTRHCESEWSLVARVAVVLYQGSALVAFLVIAVDSLQKLWPWSRTGYVGPVANGLRVLPRSNFQGKTEK